MATNYGQPNITLVFWNISVTQLSFSDRNNLITPFIIVDMVRFLRWAVENLQETILLSLTMHEQIWGFFTFVQSGFVVDKMCSSVGGTNVPFSFLLRQPCPK